MLKENVANLLFIFAFSSAGLAQQVLMGKIVRKESTEPLRQKTPQAAPQTG
jgi:hypothetical protein